MSHSLAEFDSRRSNTPPPPVAHKPTKQVSLAVWLLLISIAFAVLNFSVSPVVEVGRGPGEAGDCWALFCIGSICGQAGLLAIVAVFGPYSALRRHLFVVPILAALVMAGLLGFCVAWAMADNPRSYPSLKTVAGVLLVLPLLFCVSEFPLWIFRTLGRWRIEFAADGVTRLPHLTIAGILSATAVVGLSLGAVRLGQNLSGVSDESIWWLRVGVAAVINAGFSVVVLPVVTAIMFRTQSLIIGALASASWIGLLSTVYVVVMCLLAGSFPIGEILMVVFFPLGFCATLLGPLALCRHFGYRLLWGSTVNHVVPAAGK